MKKSTLFLVFAAVLLIGAGVRHYAGMRHYTATGQPSLSVNNAPTGIDSTDTRALLDSLTVVSDVDPVAGYSREEFGDGWATQADGCDTRADLLTHTSSAPVTRHGRCTVLTGRWVASYNGRTYTRASQTQIDHIVPLHYAWDVAASHWTADQRAAFANDDSELVVSDVHDNEVKQDDMPPDWEPIAADRCAYAEQMVAELAEWRIPVTASVKPALASMLGTC